MLTALKKLQAFTAKTTAHPLLNCIKIGHGQCTATNISITLSLNIPELAHLNCCVPADKLIQAVSAAKAPATLKQDGCNLIISAGKFKTTVPTLETIDYPETPRLDTKGEDLVMPLLPILKTLQPFQFPKPQKNSIQAAIHHKEGQWSATNGNILATIPGPKINKEIIVPSEAVAALLKLNQEPQTITIGCEPSGDAASFTCAFNATDFFSCSLIAGVFPDINRILQSCDFDSPFEIEDEFREALATVMGFSEGEYYKTLEITKKGLKAGMSEYAILGLTPSRWAADKLGIVIKAATHIDFTAYPKPCAWYGENGLKGAIAGLKQNKSEE